MLKTIEKLMFFVGVVLVGFCAFTYVTGHVYSRMALDKFHPASSSQSGQSRHGDGPQGQVDYSLWSEKRIQQYEASLKDHFDEPLGVLRIEKIRLEVPVFNGTDDLTLNRGVGRIIGTGRPGRGGNLGIAGHRDGFFRGLKDIAVGDTIRLDLPTVTQTYTIDSIKIVSPNDVSVLSDQGSPTLTLVTCYPFYFIGSAPQRYIVHASLSGTSSTPTSPERANSRTDLNSKEKAQ